MKSVIRWERRIKTYFYTALLLLAGWCAALLFLVEQDALQGAAGELIILLGMVPAGVFGFLALWEVYHPPEEDGEE